MYLSYWFYEKLSHTISTLWAGPIVFAASRFKAMAAWRWFGLFHHWFSQWAQFGCDLWTLRRLQRRTATLQSTDDGGLVALCLLYGHTQLAQDWAGHLPLDSFSCAYCQSTSGSWYDCWVSQPPFKSALGAFHTGTFAVPPSRFSQAGSCGPGRHQSAGQCFQAQSHELPAHATKRGSTPEANQRAAFAGRSLR